MREGRVREGRVDIDHVMSSCQTHLHWITNVVIARVVGIHDYHLAGVRVHSTGQHISIRLRGVHEEH